MSPGSTAAVGTVIAVAFTWLLGGLAVMFMSPLAHEVVGTPDRHPSYLASTLFVILARAVYGLIQVNLTQQPETTKSKKLIY